MARPYSFDLRARVLNDVVTGASIRALASRFGVSPSFVSKLHSRYRRTGSLAPDRQGGDYRSHRIEAEFAGGEVWSSRSAPCLASADRRPGLPSSLARRLDDAPRRQGRA